MNIISCDNCGAVLDLTKLHFPEKDGLYRQDGDIDTDIAVWDGEEYKAKIQCPVCGDDVVEP